MVLDNASTPTLIDDPFSDPFSDPSSMPHTYPPPPALAPLSWLLRYNTHDRERYIQVQQALHEAQLGVRLTAPEKAALSYYNALFYSYESYGDVLGLSAGLLLGFAMRNRRPGMFITQLTRPLRVGGSMRLWIVRAVRLTVLGAVGRMYGLTTAGYQALTKIREEQKMDPNLQRYNKALATWQSRREDMIRRGVSPPPIKGVDRRDRTVIEEMVASEEGLEAPEDPVPAESSYRSPQAAETESAWERIRRGQYPRGDETGEGSWRAQFGDNVGERTDGYTAEGTEEEERALAKAQAQREFDAQVERERKGGDEWP